jgi:hypothetical protein
VQQVTLARFGRQMETVHGQDESKSKRRIMSKR